MSTLVKLSYVEKDGLLYPDIVVDDSDVLNTLGKYGEMRLKFLHEHKPEVYQEFLITGRLSEHCE